MKVHQNLRGGGERRRSLVNVIIQGLVLVLLSSHTADTAAVMSVDLGSEWIKIGIASSAVGGGDSPTMEIVLNKDSKPKAAMAVSFHDGERLIGDDALSVAVRFPPNAYLYFLDLIGKRMDNPIVQLFQKRFPHYRLVADVDRGTVIFQHDEETFYSPEELLAMVLKKCREYAKEFAHQPVKEAVITVPPFFNQAERRGVLTAAELAGLKVLRLMNSNTATALHYGVSRSEDFENKSKQNILLYDMGASSTVATIVSYKIVRRKEQLTLYKWIIDCLIEATPPPQVSVLGIGYDRTLGGLEMQIRLRDFLGKAFNDMKKTETDIFINQRSMAKLFQEAGRVKNVLSSNDDHYAQVEGLLDGQDFKTKITRKQFEKLNEDLFERVKRPVEQALNSSGLTIDSIDKVILMGAGTRVPKVQKELTDYLKMELGESLNKDEAAALGAVYRAAELSEQRNELFMLEKFIIKDTILFPMEVEFVAAIDKETLNLETFRQTLFSSMNPYPQTKISTTFSDFNAYVSYGDLSAFPEREVAAIGAKNLTKIAVRGVAAALKKMESSTDGESKGIKVNFTMDDSGLLRMNVESVFEKNPTEVDTGVYVGVRDTVVYNLLQTIVSISIPMMIIGSGNDDGQNKHIKKQSTVEKRLVKETLVDMTVNILDIPPLDGEKFKAAKEKLLWLNMEDLYRVARDKVRIELEAFVIDMRNKILNDEDYKKVATEKERRNIIAVCLEISHWLYHTKDGSQADKLALDEKLWSLKRLTRDLEARVKERKNRPVWIRLD